MFQGCKPNVLSLLLCLGCLVVAGNLVGAAPPDGRYEGTTDQGRSISLTVSGSVITGYRVYWACGGSSGDTETFGMSCAVAPSGSFACGDASCPSAPYSTNIRISGVFTGSSVAGTFDLAFKTGVTGGCCYLNGVSWSASLVGGTSSLSIDDTTVVEGDSGTVMANFQVSLSPASSSTVTVGWATADGTATSSDYAPGSGTLTFSPGETSKPVSVAVYGDTVVEANEVFYVDLSNASGAAIGRGRGQCTIVDDDSAGSPQLDVVIPAAARGAGAAGSVWLTRLYLRNTGSGTATVALYWFNRGEANPDPPSQVVSIAPGATMVLDDVILESFGLTSGGGAIGVASSQPLVASAAILNTAGGTEFGQGFQGVPVENAIAAGESLSVVGLKHNSDYRTNVYLVDATGAGSTATVSIVNTAGTVIGSRQYTLGAFTPRLDSLETFGVPSFDDAAMVVSVASGSVIAGASRVNQRSGDPVTLATQAVGSGGVGVDGRYRFTLGDSWGWFGGGGFLDVAGGRVEYVEMSYLNLDHPSCNFIFPVTVEFPAGADLSSFSFSQEYQDGGRMAFVFSLAHNGSTGLSGTADATGSNFSGDDTSCNGSFPQLEVRAGREE